ncbi:hypothetical protein CP532_1429 [Ophiocordyceps camponoti-leonardi (nom. inval.)]|nr:hypothetical protein CP532_1429 [Ophiocordyceps camponoti-leonardi (nom. inval.)]
MKPCRLPRGARLAKSGCSSVAILCSRRSVSHSYMAKVSAAAERWAARAEKIKNGEAKTAWDVLCERGFVKDVAGCECPPISPPYTGCFNSRPKTDAGDGFRNSNLMSELMRLKRIGAYLGVDPTSDSMHVGHLIPLMALFWLWFEGHPTVLLLGGATARIGDPIGRTESRPIMSNADISRNITKMHFQMSKLWFNADDTRRRFQVPSDWGAKHHLLNNSMWQNGLTMYEFNKRISRHVRMGPMLSREWVKQRVNNESGMSFGEFMYPLLQGWDFWHLYNKLGIQMQIGGSDQFGNIITGIETLKIIRETEEVPHDRMLEGWLNEPVGFTTPLFTDAKGNKLGKADGNAGNVSLDEFQTTPYNLYGFFVRQPDEEVERLLKLLTFYPMNKIQEIMQEHQNDPKKRVAQHELAFQVLCLVHGVERAKLEARQHNMLHHGEPINCDKWTPGSPHPVDPNNAPKSDIELPESVMDLPPGKILVAVGLAETNSEGHRLVSSEGAYVAAQPSQDKSLLPGSLSWTPMKMWFPGDTRKFLIDDQLLILRKGKHNVRIVRLVSDEKWKESGRRYPGEARTGKLRIVKEQLIQEAKERGENLSVSQLATRLREKMKGHRDDLDVGDATDEAWWGQSSTPQSASQEAAEDRRLPKGNRQPESKDRWATTTDRWSMKVPLRKERLTKAENTHFWELRGKRPREKREREQEEARLRESRRRNR